MQETQAKPKPGSATLFGALAVAAVVLVFYQFLAGFGPDQVQSPIEWLRSAWNPENDFEHGFMVPLIIVGLLVWQRDALRQAAAERRFESRHDLAAVAVMLVGAVFFVLAHRTGQARLALGGLPFLLWGSAWFLWGWGVAKLTFFPLFLFWLAIPVPQFQQATTQLQILATKLAQIGSGWFGVETRVLGTEIHSVSENWEPLKINESCGGVRSLMALILISTVWAFVARMPLWKKAILCLSAFPLAILGNMLRLTSIFVIAEYGNADFAANTWHDWSGLLVFYPISLLMLLALHSLLEGGMPKMKGLRPARRVVRREVHAGGGSA